MNEQLIEKLKDSAREAVESSYSPYSHFRVGAAVLASGNIHKGANIENASYSMTVCAERNAIFRAVLAGDRDLQAICVYHDGDEMPYPCGACLQVMSEFCSDMDIIICSNDKTEITKLSVLLPGRFTLNH